MIRFARALEAQQDVPRLDVIWLWIAQRNSAGLVVDEVQVMREIKKRWPELPGHRAKWIHQVACDGT